MKLTAALEQEQEANQKRLHDLAVMQSRADAQEKMCIRDRERASFFGKLVLADRHRTLKIE